MKILLLISLPLAYVLMQQSKEITPLAQTEYRKELAVAYCNLHSKGTNFLAKEFVREYSCGSIVVQVWNSDRSEDNRLSTQRSVIFSKHSVPLLMVSGNNPEYIRKLEAKISAKALRIDKELNEIWKL